MSKIEGNGFAKSEPAHGVSAGVHPLDAEEWQERLSMARAKREQVLSAKADRNIASIKATPKTATDVPALVVEAPAKTRDSKAAVVFAGAAGLGLGLVLGVGLLFGLGNPSAVDEPARVQALPPVVAVQTAALSAPSEAPPSAAPIFETSIVMPQEKAPQTAAEANMPNSLADAITAAVLEAGQMPGADVIPAAYAVPNDATTQSDAIQPAPEIAVEAEKAAYVTAPAPVMFYIHAPDGVPDQRLQGYVSQLQNAGVDVAEVGRETFRVSTTHLRYYSPETETIARDVARDLGVEARDFSQNTVNSERIEVWIAGRPKAVTESSEERRTFFEDLRTLRCM